MDMTRDEIKAKAQEIADRFSNNNQKPFFTISTCELAPSYGWDEFQYRFIDVITRCLSENYNYKSSRKFGVNDYEFTMKV